MKDYILKFKGKALFYLLAGLLASTRGVMSTYCTQYMIDIVTEYQTDKIANMFWIILAYALFDICVLLIYGVAKNGFTARIMQEIRGDLFGSLMRQNVVALAKENTGYYTSLFLNDLKVVETTIVARFELIIAMSGLILSFVYAFLWNKMLALVLIAVGLGGLTLPVIAQKIMQRNQEVLMDEAAKHNAFINDNLHGLEVIKNYQAEAEVLKKYADENNTYAKKTFKNEFVRRTVGNLTNTCVLSLQELVIAFAGLLALSGQMEASYIMVVVTLSTSVVSSMNSFLEYFIDVKAGKSVSSRLFEQIVPGQDETADQLVDFKQTFALSHVTFTYPNKETAVLEDLNVVFEKGKKYLITGESGSGKSTFIKLLLQYYEDYEGSISLDGMDVRRLPRKSVLQEFGVIPQNVFVFEDTLRNNITLYTECSEERVMEAVKQAGLSELVEKLPDGLDYVIKEGGMNLSGGERQRISIARAFFHNRKIWIMDEATSNLNKELAQQIEQTVLNIPDVTVIMIAHYYNEDISRQCDGIYRIEKRGLHRL